MVQAQTCLAMAIHLQANTDMGSLRVMVSIDGKMVVSILESFKMDLNMGRASGERMKASTAISLRETTLMTRNMDLEHFNGKVGTYTKETIRKMKEMAMGRCIGQMGLFIKEIGFKGSSMDMAN
jgi:hypothetical protein